MFYRTIYVCLFGFALALFDEEHSPEITFEINLTTDNRIVCDHTMDEIHTYTVREGEKFKLITKYNYFIHDLICGNKMFPYNKYTKNDNFKEITFNVISDMTLLATLAVPYFNSAKKASRYRIALSLIGDSPQTILVNNMVLDTLRTDLSIKDVDFTAEYQYADGDVVHLTCATFSNPTLYTMTGTMRDISTIKDLSANYTIGFRAKLGAGHHNTYIICNNTGPTDYIKVMVRFVMRTEFNYVSIQINGMTLRPKLTNVLNNHYEIEYRYQKKQSITLVCEVRTDLKLMVMKRNDSFIKSDKRNHVFKTYQRTDYLYPKKKSEIILYTESAADVKIYCATDYLNDTRAEQVANHFTLGNYRIDQYPLRMTFLPSSGKVMELYGDYKLKVFFYEFEDGETLQLNCGPLYMRTTGPALYIQFGDSDTCNTMGCHVSKTLHLTRKDENTKIVYYLKEKSPYEEAEVLREIRVIFRERVVTTTSTTRTTTTTRSIEHQYPLRMTFLPSSGKVMELYGDYKLKVFFYEFEDGETLQLNCGPLYMRTTGPALYIQFGDSDTCNTMGCHVSKTLHLTRKDENTKIVCYLKEKSPYEEAEVLREIRVIFRERVVTTTSTTRTTTTTRSIEHQYLLRMTFLPSNGTVMELYGDYKLKVFFYEFEDGETLQLNCGPLYMYSPEPVLYIQFDDSDICNLKSCNVSKTLHLTRKYENTKIVCYLKEKIPYEEAEVLREIWVIFRERVVTTTSTTTTTTTTRSIEHAETTDYNIVIISSIFLIMVLVIFVICAIRRYSCKKSNRPERAQLPLPETPGTRLRPVNGPDPNTPFYVNLLFRRECELEIQAREEPHYEEVIDH